MKLTPVYACFYHIVVHFQTAYPDKKVFFYISSKEEFLVLLDSKRRHDQRVGQLFQSRFTFFMFKIEEYYIFMLYDFTHC